MLRQMLLPYTNEATAERQGFVFARPFQPLADSCKRYKLTV